MRARGPSNDLRPAPGERLYRALLHLYPRDFRARYGEAMVEFYRDRWHAERSRGIGAGMRIWRGVAADLVGNVAAERLNSARERRKRLATTPLIPETRDGSMTMLAQDLRFALRGLGRRPAFTAVVLATLALGIGANVAIFSVVNGILLRPLPFRDVAGIIHLRHEEPYSSISEPEYVDYARDTKSLARLAAYGGAEANLTGVQEPERVRVARVADGFFAILGVPPAQGRGFTKDDDIRGHARVALISHGLWQRRFAADPAAVGGTIELNGTPITIVGVMPPRFDFPAANVAVWVPLRLDPDSLWTRNNHYLQAIGRLAPGASVTGALREMTVLARRWSTDYPETYFPGKPLRPRVIPIADEILGSTRPYLLALLGAVGFVLLIACANVANLLLARGEGRRKELAIRTALGASRSRIARQLLTESAMLALAGGALGLIVAWWGSRTLLALAPSSIPRLEDVRIDGAVLAFTLGVSLLTGVLFGLVPALRAARAESVETLKEGGKTMAPSMARRTRSALVVAEVALAVVMVAGAGLLVRSLWKLQQTDLGFDPSGTLTMSLALPPRAYQEDARAVQLFRDLLDRIDAMPGVRSTAAMGWAPLDADGSSWSIMVDGKVVKNISESPSAQPAQVTAGYFATLRIPIVKGRAFTEADRADAPIVAIVNETMARQLWPGQDPLGHTIKMFQETAPWATVVGVAKDIRSQSLQGPEPPTMFFPYAQVGKSAYYTPLQMTVAVRTEGDPTKQAPAVRQAVRRLDPNIPISDVRTMDDIVGASVASRRFTTTLLGAFAGLAVVLAGIGIYGVIAYGVSQRTYEIGVRMALGAQQRAVLMLVMREGLRMAAVGLAIGIVGAVAVARVIRSLLVGVTVADPLALAAAAVVLVAVAALASLLPAQRAMAVSPTEALRGS